MKIIIGADHAGYKIKEKIKKFLIKNEIEYEDIGTNSEKSVDYPDYAKKAAKKVAQSKNMMGILVCGTGTGMTMAANKIKGIRAVAAYDEYSAKMSRNDNDANILGLRGRNFPYNKIEKIVKAWLGTPFSGKQRHKRRISKLQRMMLNKFSKPQGKKLR